MMNGIEFVVQNYRATRRFDQGTRPPVSGKRKADLAGEFRKIGCL